MTRTVSSLVIVLALGLLAGGCGGTESQGATGGGEGSSELSLVAYSTPREAYEELIERYTAGDGAGTSFTQSYGSSGDQARAVTAGLHADVVALSLAPDVQKLVDEGIVAPDWASADDHDGFVTKSVVSFIVRKGNPKDIQGWEDLLRDDVEVLNPNPFTSGGARWNVMAAYGAQLQQGRPEEDALAYLEALYDNIGVQDKAARESLQTFVSGRGDVLLGYENEAILAQQQGEEVDYVIPDETLLIENPIAVTEGARDPAGTERFVDWLRTEPAQEVFAEKGYRTVLKRLADEEAYPTPKRLFTIEDVGGWDQVMTRFFDPEDSVMQRIQERLGVSTG